MTIPCRSCLTPTSGVLALCYGAAIRHQIPEFFPMVYVVALLIGVIAGLRAMTAPAAVSWAAYLDWLPVDDTWAWFMGHWLTPWIFTVLAIIELITDQLPST